VDALASVVPQDTHDHCDYDARSLGAGIPFAARLYLCGVTIWKKANEVVGVGTVKASAPSESQQNLVPGARIELATPAFSGRRSTTELPRH
jgi:hypothetical protein